MGLARLGGGICLIGGIGSLALFFLLAWRWWRQGYELSVLMWVLGAVTWIQAANALSCLFVDQALLWRQIALLGEIMLPVTLCYVGLSLTTQLGSPVEPGTLWRFRALSGVAAGLVLLVIGAPQWVLADFPGREELLFVRPWGRVLWGYVVFGLVLGLTELERILRASRDPLRYQLKFILIGLGGIAGIGIVQASQLLLSPVWKPEFVWIGAIGVLVSLGLIALGIGRWRVRMLAQHLYFSPQALYASFTFLIVGAYLIGVGLLAEVIQRTGWRLSEVLAAVLVFAAVLGLVVVGCSRQARAQLRLMISRHFYRSKYDYRLQWLGVTEAFTACDSIDRILDTFLHILGQTFGAARISIWLVAEADQHVHQVRSLNTEGPMDPLPPTHPVVTWLKDLTGPVEVDQSGLFTDEAIRAFMTARDAAVLVPLRTASERLLGFVVLGRDWQNRPYEKDDCDLLKVMTHHVAMLLAQLKVMEERAASAKWEAVHRFSAFYLHDLKNLASGLSLVVQNAESYGDDPDFRKSAMKTIGNTAQRMKDLMAKLSGLAVNPADAMSQPFHQVDVNSLVRETVAPLQGMNGHLRCVLQPSLLPVSAQSESLKQVLLNVVLNARQAAGEEGNIEVTTGLEGNDVTISVSDDGPGIPSDRMRTLFEPFVTTKKGGLGVGLYQCKDIVERHRGRLRVESREGQGTRVMIHLPRWSGGG